LAISATTSTARSHPSEPPVATRILRMVPFRQGIPGRAVAVAP
jgi:hypothetical protein